MNPVFRPLAQRILDNIEDQLVNHDEAHDGELWDLMVEELGLNADQADAAVALLPLYRGRLYQAGQSPLYQSNSISLAPLPGELIADEPLSFDQILAAYRTLLLGRPGQRLKLGAHWAAGLNAQGDLYCTQLDPHDESAMFEVFHFDPEAFFDGHWQCETVEQTRSAVFTPVFIQ
ncbi:hypothetical protein V2I93_04085 [Pseudomonas viridiflava]|uniref:hypothetical protein n=1 Tax=Pseudomonas viridiflava TaxID=33069 RepID=UPI002EC0C9CC|nr:hypothetical protein [Pseudomonas viridiflava]